MERIKRHLTTIVVAFVTATVAAGGTAAVAGVINANKLNGYAANQLIRVAVDNRKTVGWLPGILGTATIVAPNKGYLVITASSDMDDSTGINNGTVHCWITIDGKKITASQRTFRLSPTSTAAITTGSCASNVAWAVAKGGHTVRLVSDNPDGLNVTFGPTAVSALYEPFNASGRVPTPVTPS